MKKNLEKAVKFLIYTTFLMPLVVLPTAFIFPFIVPKVLFFRSLVELMLGLYVLLLIINWKEYRPQFSALNIALVLFLISFLISTFVGSDPYHSFWDNHERMLGLLTIFHYVIYYYICSKIFKGWQEWRWLMQIFLLAGGIVMFIGVLQTQNPELLLNRGSERVSSTLGNSIYLGGYGLFLFFVSILLFVKEKNSVWRIMYVPLAVLSLLGIFFSGTRGSMLGLVAGLVATIIGYILVLKNYPRARWSLTAVAVLGVVVVGLLYGFRGNKFVQNIPAVGRTVRTSLTDVKSSPRFIAWEIAIQSWKEKPVFGWGPNNFFYAFNKYYNPRSLDFGYGETWFDNAHNIILNTLAVQGAFGILTYLGIFVLGIGSLVYARRRQKLDYHIVVLGSAFLVAHLIQNITVFENPTSYLYFMLWLAFINSTVQSRSEASGINDPQLIITNLANNNIKSERRLGFGLPSLVLVVVLIMIFIFNIQPAVANMKTLAAIRYLSQPALTAPAISAAREALNFSSPHIDDIRADVARTVAQTLGSNYKQLGAERSQEIFDLTYEELQKNLILHPLDIRNHLTLAQLAQTGVMFSNKIQYALEAEKYLTEALVNSPKRQQLIYSLAGLKTNLGRNAEAIKLLEGAVQGNPAIAESYTRLAFVYKLDNKMDKVKEVLDLATKNGVVFTEQESTTIRQILNNKN